MSAEWQARAALQLSAIGIVLAAVLVPHPRGLLEERTLMLRLPPGSG